MSEPREAGARTPYDDKTIAEIIHDYAVVRGDLTEQYARDQLVQIVERRLAEKDAEIEQWKHTARETRVWANTELATSDSALADVTRERDDLRARVDQAEAVETEYLFPSPQAGLFYATQNAMLAEILSAARPESGFVVRLAPPLPDSRPTEDQS